MALKIMILGVNGFIGSALAERILATTDWEIQGMDLSHHKIEALLQEEHFHFKTGDITRDLDWIDTQLKDCDVLLPLVAVANPSFYVSDPLKVFELDFEANLALVRLAVKHNKHVVFPSTSEVYGMSPDTPFDEATSRLVLGPIHKQRWIYSCSKQLLDRVIYAYGEKEGLNYTLFRPFNWIGPKLDHLLGTQAGSARAFSQFLGNILKGQDIHLVDGGGQRRCFTYIDDGIDGLMQIIKRRQAEANRSLFNLGNPHNHVSVRELAQHLLSTVASYPQYADQAKSVKMIEVAGETYFGTGYQDINDRIPAISKAKACLDWEPRVSLEEAIRKTLDYHLRATLKE